MSDRPETPVDRLIERARRTGLDGFIDRLVEIARPAVAVRLRHGPRNGQAGSGFGGTPMLPLDFEWPCDPQTGEAMDFVAQIDLRDLAGTSAPSELGQEGHLVFFHCAGTGDVGTVRSIEANEALHPHPPPEATRRELFRRRRKRAVLPELRMEFESFLSLPTFEDLRTLTDAPLDPLEELLVDLREPHRLLGHADALQAAPEADFADRWPPHVWRSLLQFDLSQPECFDRIRSAGLLTFGIPEPDLRQRRYDRAAAMMQHD